MRITHTTRSGKLTLGAFISVILVLLYIYLHYSDKLIQQIDLYSKPDRFNHTKLNITNETPNKHPAFILFNMHSGWSNQRISLENGILLADTLDATLVFHLMLNFKVLPFATIGRTPFQWKPYDLLNWKILSSYNSCLKE
jgi:hypothetical protein